jgi:hypothetical protein
LRDGKWAELLHTEQKRIRIGPKVQGNVTTRKAEYWYRKLLLVILFSIKEKTRVWDLVERGQEGYDVGSGPEYLTNNADCHSRQWLVIGHQHRPPK